MIVKISLESAEESRWLAILLSNDAPPKEKRKRGKGKGDADDDATPAEVESPGTGR